jgi:hypothetical protein
MNDISRKDKAMSKLWSLSRNDFIKGMVVSVLSAVLTLILQVLQSGGKIDVRTIETVAITALVAYLLKALGTDQNGDLLGKIKTGKP